MSDNPYATPQAAVADPRNDAPPERPVMVWVICVLTWIGIAFGLLGLWLLTSNRLPIAPGQISFYSKLNIVDYLLMGGALVLSLVSSIALFLLRKIAAPLYLAGIGLGVAQLAWQIVARDWLTMMSAGGPAGYVGAVFGWVVSIAICLYVWSLARNGTLR